MQDETSTYQMPAERLVFTHQELGEGRELGDATVTCNIWGKASVRVLHGPEDSRSRWIWLLVFLLALGAGLAAAWFTQAWPFSARLVEKSQPEVIDSQQPPQTNAVNAPAMAEPPTAQPATAEPTTAVPVTPATDPAAAAPAPMPPNHASQSAQPPSDGAALPAQQTAKPQHTGATRHAPETARNAGQPMKSAAVNAPTATAANPAGAERAASDSMETGGGDGAAVRPEQTNPPVPTAGAAVPGAGTPVTPPQAANDAQKAP